MMDKDEVTLKRGETPILSEEQATDAFESKRLKLESSFPSSSKKIICNPGFKLNPLLIDLVLEKVFPYCGTEVADLENFRLVCKAWDREIVKLFRHRTEINLERIISPFPHGLGWTEASNIDGCLYEAPYSVESFENIFVAGTCKTLQDPKVIRWFQIMGSCVKKLRFMSSLSCYHQTRFLECILKRWCLNLCSIYLGGVACYTKLLHFSRFIDPLPVKCNLKEVIVLGDLEVVPESDCDCYDKLVDSYLPKDNDGANDIAPIKIDNGRPAAGDLEVRNHHLEVRMTETLGTDSGILGQIFKTSAIEKVWIKNFSSEQTDALVLAMHRKPNCIIKSLKHFEYGNFPMFLWGWQMDRFRKFQFPLTTLRFGALTTHITAEDLSALLLAFKTTLEHVKFSGLIIMSSWEDEDDEETVDITLPLLPNVKTFINENIFCTRVGGLDFVRNLPSLEKCSLTNAIYHSSIFPLNPSQVFNILFQAASFDRHTHSLRELHLDGKITYTRHIQMLKDWFPKLRKVELTFDGSDVFVEFFRLMKQSELEDIKVKFYSTDHQWCNVSMGNYLPRFEKLTFLELIHLSDNPMIVTVDAFKQGFCQTPNLKSLKLENYAVYVDEIEAIQRSASHISCLKFAKCVVQHKPADAEFSVGIANPFPSIF